MYFRLTVNFIGYQISTLCVCVCVSLYREGEIFFFLFPTIEHLIKQKMNHGDPIVEINFK